MKKIEEFYNLHYKTVQMMDWSELTAKQKITLEKSRDYWSFKFKKAVNDFNISLLNKLKKTI